LTLFEINRYHTEGWKNKKDLIHVFFVINE